MGSPSFIKGATRYVATLVLMLGCSAEIVAQERTRRGDDDQFTVGGSCAALAYADAGQLRDLTSNAFSDDFHSFCYPEEPFSCSDYTSFLKGVGRMAIGDDGFHCSLVLN